MFRRGALKLAAAAAALPLVHIRTAGAAGKLSVALWDHWVPGGNAAMKKLVGAWAANNNVDVQLDFLTAVGSQINITMAAEAQARTGHDVYAFDMWTVQKFAGKLDPVDVVVRSLTDKYGKISSAVEYLGTVDGHWMAVPVGWGSSPQSVCARIGMLKKFANIDVTQWYPAQESDPAAAAEWTYDTQLRAAEACHRGGFPFGLGCGSTTGSNQTWGATFGAFGANLIDAQDKITVDSDNVRKVLDYAKKMLPFLPPDAVSYDDASKQPGPDLRQVGIDPEPARGLGSRQAGCTGRGRGLLDVPQSPWREWTPGSVAAVFLGHLAVRPEQERRQRTDYPSIAARAGRGAGGSHDRH